MAQPRRHPDAARRQLYRRERQGLDAPLGIASRQDRAAAGGAVRGAAGLLETAAGSDRAAARAQAQIGETLGKTAKAVSFRDRLSSWIPGSSLGGAPE